MSKTGRKCSFNVPMGCFDGVAVCELVGSCVSKKISQLFEHHLFRLYRDDGLAVLKGLSIKSIKRKGKKK